MSFKLYKPLLIVLILGTAVPAFAQVEPETVKKPAFAKDAVTETNSFKFGLDYISNNVFMGRTGTVITPTLAPNAKYSFGSGIYFSGSMDFLPNNKTKKLDGGDLAAGYDFDLTDDLSGVVSYNKFFYNSASTRIGSSVSSTFNAGLDYDIKEIITPSISVDYNINRQGIPNDVFLYFGLSHDFIVQKLFATKDIFLVSPTVSINTGSQNFYDGYLTKKVFKNVKRTEAQNALVDQYEQTLSKFKLLDYEFSAPLEYKLNHFIFQFTPTYAYVENEAKSAALTKAIGLSNKTSVFYISTSLSLKF